MSLIKHWEDILNIFNINETLTLKEIESYLKITPYTIRKAIEILNGELEDIAEIVEDKGLYSLKIYNHSQFNTLKNNQLKKRLDYNSSTKRQAYILKTLFQTDSYISTLDFLDCMEVSKGTINNEIKNLRQRLADNYQLMIESVPNKGIKIMGDELKCRLAYMNHATGFFNYTYLKNETVQFVYALRTQHKIKQRNLLLLCEAIDAMLIRINLGQDLTSPINHFDNYLEHTEMYEQLIYHIEHTYQLTLSQNERDFISFPLLVDDNHIVPIKDNHSNNTLLKQVIREIGDYIEENYLIEVNMCDLFDLMANHIYFLLNRSVFQSKLTDIFYGEVERKYPFSYSLSRKILEVISKKLGVSIQNVEADYLTFYFEMLTRQHKEHQQKEIAVICNTGIGTATIIKRRIENIIGKDIKITQFSEGDYIFEDLSKYFAIITTVSLANVPKDIPIIRLSNIFNDEYLSNEWIKILNSEQTLPENTEIIWTHLDKQTNYGDQLQMMSEKLVERNLVDSAFTTRILERELRGSTIYSDNFAFPHEVNLKNQTFVLNFACHPSTDMVICMLAIPSDAIDQQSDEIMKVYDLIFALNQSLDFAEDLKQCQSTEDLRQNLLRNGVLR